MEFAEHHGHRTVKLNAGVTVPALGQGTWKMGENHAERNNEIAALRAGLDLGMTLVDTAEMYGDGGAEKIVGEAIKGRRDQVFLVSKVYPHNASRKRMVESCERSLRRLRVDSIDLYLLHWRGHIPLAETLGGFVELQQAGKIKAYGVSNFDLADLEEVWSLPGGRQLAADQVLFNLTRRGPEKNELPWCQQRGLALMAYSPVEQGRLFHQLAEVAAEIGHTPAQIAIAWLLRFEQTIVIPKSSDLRHVAENRQSWEIELDASVCQRLDAIFPRPPDARLEML